MDGENSGVSSLKGGRRDWRGEGCGEDIESLLRVLHSKAYNPPKLKIFAIWSFAKKCLLVLLIFHQLCEGQNHILLFFVF